MASKVSQPRATSRSHFLAGLSSGIGSAVLLQPFDLLKTRVQQPGSGSLSTVVRQIVSSQEQLLGLWRGTVPSALRTGFGSALYFSILNSMRQGASQFEIFTGRPVAASHSSRLPTLTNAANLATGATSRVIAGFILMPLTVVKVRYESSLYSYPSVWQSARDIYRKGGARGFFVGFGATAIRDGPYAGVYVVFYEQLKRLLSKWSVSPGGKIDGTASPKVASAATINFTSAILAGAACSVVSNPFDVIKTRIQLEPEVYQNMYRASLRILASDGAKSFFDGLALRMTRKALSSAFAWTVYEELIRWAERIGW